MWTVEKERNEAVFLYVHFHTRAVSAVCGYFPLEHSSAPLYSNSLPDAMSWGTPLPDSVVGSECSHPLRFHTIVA